MSEKDLDYYLNKSQEKKIYYDELKESISVEGKLNDVDYYIESRKGLFDTVCGNGPLIIKLGKC